MKKHILTFSLLLLASFSFAQKTQIWLGPTFTVIPKSVAQSFISTTFRGWGISGKDTSYFKGKNTFDRFDTLKFTTKIGVSGGVRWEKSLGTHFSLTYGIGLNNYNFNVINKSGFDNFKEIETTPIPKFQFDIPSNDSKFIFSNEKIKEGTDYNLTELQIPLILNWKKTDFSIGIGAQLNSPVAIRTVSENLVFEMEDNNTYRQVKKTVKTTNSNRIKRSSIDLSANYTQWIDKFGLEIGVSRRMTPFWDDNNNSDDIFFSSSSKVITTHKINPIAISLRAIYILK